MSRSYRRRRKAIPRFMKQRWPIVMQDYEKAKFEKVNNHWKHVGFCVRFPEGKRDSKS